MKASEIIEKNIVEIKEYFVGIISNEFADGQTRSLVWDKSDDTVKYELGSRIDYADIRTIHRDFGCQSYSEEEKYKKGCDLDNYDYDGFLEELERRIDEIRSEDEEFGS